MQLPRETIPGSTAFTPNSEVYLEAGHICIRNNIAKAIFGTETVVLSVFYPKEHSFLVSPSSEELFKTLHKSSQQMLKLKNAAGDRSISIQEILMDNDLNETDRNLAFVMEEAIHLLKIQL